MDTFTKSDSPRIAQFDTPEKHNTNNNNNNRLNPHYNELQDEMPSISMNHHQMIHNNEDSENTVDQKEIEHDTNENNTDHQQVPLQMASDDNLNHNNRPFHLSYHHLTQQQQEQEQQLKDKDDININNKSSDLDTKPSSSPQISVASTRSSISSSVNDLSPGFNHHHFDGGRHRFNPHIHFNSYGGHTHHRSNHRNGSHSHSRGHSASHDKLQRKVQKLEQDILSKNIQHDIMVNKEEMMTKRLKTKDIRIKNLQNDIGKLREQLTAKTESQESLINEMNKLQSQNRGLSQKLRESEIGLNVSMNDGDNDGNNYNESMRDILKGLQQNLYNITNDINDMKQNQNDSNDVNMGINVEEIRNAVQSCLSPMVDQMKQQQREFVNSLQNEQSEWISRLQEQIQSNQDIMEANYKSIEQKNEVKMQNHVNLINNKLDEIDKHNKSKMNNIYQNLKKQEIKLESLNSNYFQTFFDSANKSQQQTQDIMMNQLKQDIKREIYGMKTEIISTIKTSKNEISSNIDAVSSNVSTLDNNLKYQIKNALNANNENNNNNNDNIHKQQPLYEHQVIEQYQRSIQSQSDIINQNALKLNNLQQTINKLTNENKNIVQVIKQNTSLQNSKFTQISDENADKTIATIEGLKPLFTKLYEYFQSQNDDLVETVQQNNNDMIESFAQHKHEFQRIISSMSTENTSFVANYPMPSQDEYSQILKEIKSVKSFMNDIKGNNNNNIMSPKAEYSQILHEIKSMKLDMNNIKSKNDRSSEMKSLCKNLQQMTRRHDDIIRLVTNALPSTMDKLKTDSNRLSEMYHNLSKSIQDMETWYKLNPHHQSSSQSQAASVINNNKQPPSPQRNVYKGGSDEKLVQTMKSMILSQIDEMKKRFNVIDSNIKTQIDRILQQINSSNVKMYNNFKSVQDNYKQSIVDLGDVNLKKRISSHETLLKGHLQKIAKNLQQLHQSQVTVNMALTSQQQNISNIPSIPPLTDQKSQSQSSTNSQHLNIQQNVSEMIQRSNEMMKSFLNSKVEEVKDEFRKMLQSPTSSSGGFNGGDDEKEQTQRNQEILIKLKEIKQYMDSDMTKAIVRISNFVSDIHKKIEQLPHKMAYKKDVQKLEQTFRATLSQENMISASHPIQTTLLSNARLSDQNGESIDEFMGVLMMKFTEWLAQISEQLNQDNCSVHTMIYILSKIAFTTFIQSASNVDGDEHKDDEKGKDDENNRIKANLSQIQMDALRKLKEIERELEFNEFDGDRTIHQFIQWIADIYQSSHEWLRQTDNIWMPRGDESGMQYICNQEFKINHKLNGLKDGMNLLVRGQTAWCSKKCVFQSISGICAIFVAVTAVLIMKMLTEDNAFW